MTLVVKPVAASSKCSFLLFGDPSAGKTVFIGSGGKQFKILIIRSPRDKVDSILGSGVEEIVVSDWEEMTEARHYLHNEGEKYDWVWLDSLSIWQDVGLQDVYEAALDRKGAPGSPGRAEREQFGKDKGEYGINMDRLSQLIGDLSGSDQFHFGVTCHPFWGERLQINDDPDEDVTTDSEQIQPWIQGKNMVSKICGYMNVVGYLDVGEMIVRGQLRTVRRLKVEKSPRAYVKNQFKTDTGESIFGNGTIINPTLPKFMEALATRRTDASVARVRNRTRPTKR